MSKEKIREYIICLPVIMVLSISGNLVSAQPTPEELAGCVVEVTQERIQHIDRLTLTNTIVSGVFEGQETTNVLEKKEHNGRYDLIAVETDGFLETSETGGFSHGIYDDVIRHARSVEHDTYEGHPVYRVYVDDQEFLSSMATIDELMDDNMEPSGQPVSVESFTFFLDREDLVMHHGTFDYKGSLQIHYTLSDYQWHSGLPVPMVTEIAFEGLGDMFTEEELAEARQALQMMEERLDAMPDAQREMIKQQFGDQLEQYKLILESGDIEDMRVEVTELVIN